MRLVLALAAGLAASPALAAAPPPAAADPEPPAPLLNETLEHQRSGVEVPWSDPASGRAGTIRVERTFYRGQQPCRDFVWTQQAAGAGKVENGGTGCRVGKARWEIERKPAPPPATTGSSAAAVPPSPPPASGDTVAAKPAPEPPRPARKPPALVFTMPTRSEL